MNKINICLLFPGVLAVFILSGCKSSIIQLYSGPELPESEIALLKIYPYNKAIAIDGKDITADFEGKMIIPRVAMLPGMHSISWITITDYLMFVGPPDKTTNVTPTAWAAISGSGVLDAKPGKLYCLSYKHKRGDMTGRSVKIRMMEIIESHVYGFDDSFIETKDFTPRIDGTKVWPTAQ